ncbi:MAG TPA: hypothetical protein VN653_20100 [Anaerolineales bacterium]|nr:hypothetical protein [Anaerolineales bacterium]
MNKPRQFSSTLESLVEIKSDDVAPPEPVQAVPSLSRVLSEIGSLPREALFLGIALDGLPVLLNLHDPAPGPLLLVSDAGAGKTDFLKVLAQGVQQMHRSEVVQFGVITNHAEEWEGLESSSHYVGVFPLLESRAQEFIHSLAVWAHTQRRSRQSVLLMIDDLEVIPQLEPATLHNLRWLLLRGTSHGVWPILTLNARRYAQVVDWIPMFRTRIFGRIEDESVAAALGGDKASALNQLAAGVQFSLRENGQWLRFWLPSC